MHRLPLKLETPSISWDRNLPEHVLFERTLNRSNVLETDNFLVILDKQSTILANDAAAVQMVKVNAMLGSGAVDMPKAMNMINSIILRAPKENPVLAEALFMRAQVYFNATLYTSAAADYEMFLHANRKTNDYKRLCEVYGKLTICFHLMRNFEKIKKYLREYNKYKGKISQECFRNTELGEMSDRIKSFENELHDNVDLAPKISDFTYFSIPYKGFNKNGNIPFCSAACYYIDESKNQEQFGVYTNCDIPIGSVVLVEEPIMQSVNMPFLQCEFCFQKHLHIYTCLDCRYKSYCSLKCMEQDREFHELECLGYSSLILLVLDAVMLFRIFIHISYMLNDHVFSLKVFRKLTTAAEVLEQLELFINEKEMHSSHYLNLLNKKPNYQKLSDMQYATLVATAFRLTIFIEKKTLIIENFYQKLNISNKQKMILTGVILMRLNSNLITNTFDFEYNYPLYTFTPKCLTIDKQIFEMSSIVKPERNCVVTDIADFYKIDNKMDIFDRSSKLREVMPNVNITPALLPHLLHTTSCNRIQRPISTYMDIITESHFSPGCTNFFLYGASAGSPTTQTSVGLICGRIAEMDDSERYNFVYSFTHLFHKHFVDYFLQIHQSEHVKVQQIFGLLCKTLSKFRHACNPNVEVVVLENGVVMGKALRTIRQGEELLVSYKANYTRHSRVERSVFLKRLDLGCRCEYCSMSEISEPNNQRLGIYCDSCEDRVLITPAQSKCPKCHTHYNNLLQKYRTEMTLYDIEIARIMKPNANDRDLYILHEKSYLHVTQYFVSCNEFHIRVALRYAKFLALKNFAKQSYRIVMEVKIDLMENYEECGIWFTFYAEILTIIKIILYYNINEYLYTLSESSLQDLCRFGLYITEGQKEHLLMYETFDYESVVTIDDMRLLLEWKEKLLCSSLLPLKDSFKKKDKSKKTGGSKSKDDLMPTLSKVSQ